MAMNLTRTGTAAVVGVGSGAIASQNIAPLNLGGQSIGYDTVFELVATLGGAAMQFLSPFTAANVVDGAVDGGIALLAARGTKMAMGQISAGGYAAHRVGAFAAPQLSAGSRPFNYRGQIGSIVGVPKTKLT